MKRKLTTVSQPQQKKTVNIEKPLLGRLIKWTVWIILVITLVLHIVYITGSYRNASDDSQLALVHHCLVFSLLLIISSFYGLILVLYYTARKRNLAYITAALGYAVLIILGALALFGAMFVIGAVRVIH